MPESRWTHLLDFIRGVVRPSVTWIGFVAITLVVLQRAWVLREAPQTWYVGMVAGMIAYWFAERNHK